MNETVQEYSEPEVIVDEPKIEEHQDEIEVAQGDETVEADWTDDDADEARAFGWKAPDEWRGDKPKGYIDDPRRYLDRLTNSKPFRTMAERTEKLEADFQERTRKMEAMSQRVLADQKARHEAELARISAEKLRAVDLADTDAYKRLDAQEKALQAPSAVEPAQPKQDPYVQEYVANNPWTQNPMLQQLGAAMIDANPAMLSAGPSAQFAYAESMLRKLHPEFFPASSTPEPAKPAPRRAPVDGGGLAGGGNAASGFEKLPTEARSAFKKFVAEGIFADTPADRKKYMDEYNAA